MAKITPENSFPAVGDKRFEFFDPLQDPHWDESLLERKDASFFHTAAWANVLKSTYGYKPIYLRARRGNQFSTMMPMMEVDSGVTGRRGISLPFTDECDALISEVGDSDAIFRETLEEGRRRRWKYVECRGIVLTGAISSITFYRHTLDLGKTEDALFARCESGVRRAIRKGKNQGIDVRRSQTIDSVRVFYLLHQKTRRKHGLPPQPFAFFQSMHQHVLAKNFGFVLIAYCEKIPIAGAVFFHFRGKAIYKFGASDAKFLHMRGNNAVMWEAITFLARNRYSELSMGRTEMANEGLREFKRGWGSKEESLVYCRYDFTKEKFVTTPDRVRGWYNRLFRHMPFWASRCAGKVLYQHIA